MPGMHQLSLPAVLAVVCLGVACASDPGADGGAAGGAGSGKGGGAGTASGAAGASGSAGSGGVISAGSGGAGSGNGGSAGSTGGAAGSTGGGGASGGGNTSGGSGGSGMTPSLGCGTEATQVFDQWVEQPALTIDSVERNWWVWLPAGYDETRAYPIVFLFHGCSSGDNNVPMQDETGADAILVRGVGVSPNTCWDASPDGPDVTFFDEMLADVLQNHCADSSRVFAAGYSSGSWLINTLECRRGDKLRAAGSVAGGSVQPGDCVGQVARIFVHDLDDNDNDISGSETERDRLLVANNCDAAAPPVPEEPAPCARYQGCDAGFPVIWCETSGQGHDRQDDLAAPAFWSLFSEL